MIRRLVPLFVLAGVLAVAMPAEAAWNVTGAASQTDNGKTRTLAAPTNLGGTCSYNKGTNTVSVSLNWTVSTSTITAKQKLYKQGNPTGAPVTYATTTTINDNTTHTGSDSFSHGTGSVSYRYAVSAVVGTAWESTQTKTAAFTLSTAGATGSCSVTFS